MIDTADGYIKNKKKSLSNIKSRNGFNNNIDYIV